MTKYVHGIWHDDKRQSYRARKVVGGVITRRSFRYRRAEDRAKARADALEWLRNMERQAAGLAPSNYMGPELGTLARDYLAELQKYGRPASTLDYYTRKFAWAISYFGETERPGRITQARIQRYVDARLTGSEAEPAVSAGTVAKELKALATLYRHSDLTPSWKVPPLLLRSVRVKRRRIPTVDDAARLWLVVGGPARAAIGLSLFAGLRAADVMRADAAWCDWKAGELYVPEESKEGEPNRLPIVPALAEALPRWGRLVPTTPSLLASALRSASRALGITPPVLGPGVFRHCCATWLGELGYPKPERELVTGHARDVHERYTHGQQIDLKRRMLTALEAYFLQAVERVREEPAIGEARSRSGLRPAGESPGSKRKALR